jgi:hypothetical protein
MLETNCALKTLNINKVKFNYLFKTDDSDQSANGCDVSVINPEHAEERVHLEEGCSLHQLERRRVNGTLFKLDRLPKLRFFPLLLVFWGHVDHPFSRLQAVQFSNSIYVQY